MTELLLRSFRPTAQIEWILLESKVQVMAQNWQEQTHIHVKKFKKVVSLSQPTSGRKSKLLNFQ